MSTVPNPARYPIPLDDRLTDSVVVGVADFLQYRGFPYVEGPDLERLREALHGFLYGAPTGAQQ